ncbi:hypothetical protein [Winogradskyella ursingii]|uniref:hypothetical protein n=1 Tax=Winogradskyella ursingii TaxID=2686079 RepID=UPI0015C73883|nr:hypothetical protein [Winogradskyella ursingii]
MKKQLLFLAIVLSGITCATAATAGNAVLNGEDFKDARYRYSQPIVFVERGVEFLIFKDGTFDFNTSVNSTFPKIRNYNRRTNTRRNVTNRTFGAPGTAYHYGGRGVLVTHDTFGRVRRVGNVFINYDNQGKIKRAGSVYMDYRRGRLSQVGGLKILYNRYGKITKTRGHVNLSNQACGFCGVAECSTVHYDDFSHKRKFKKKRKHRDYEDWDVDDFYYYKKNDEI